MLEHRPRTLRMVVALQVVAHHGLGQRIHIDIHVAIVARLAVDKRIARPILLGAQRITIHALHHAQRLLGRLLQELLRPLHAP